MVADTPGTPWKPLPPKASLAQLPPRDSSSRKAWPRVSEDSVPRYLTSWKESLVNTPRYVQAWRRTKAAAQPSTLLLWGYVGFDLVFGADLPSWHCHSRIRRGPRMVAEVRGGSGTRPSEMGKRLMPGPTFLFSVPDQGSWK